MRQLQAASTLAAVRDARGRGPTFRSRRIDAICVATALIASLQLVATAEAQIRRPVDTGPNYGWWISGGAAAASIGDITDGASKSKWHFGSDPILQYRATLEKALDEFTTLGVAASYGSANLALTNTATGTNAKLPTDCQVTCAAKSELWTGMAQFRSGGGTGFHTLFEASAGGTVFRNFKTTADAVAVPGIKSSFDLTGTLGLGFGYPLSRTMVLGLVQDYGIAFHSKTDLPAGVGRTWRVRNTRLSLRMHFGGR